MDKVIGIKIKQKDGIYSDMIPIDIFAENIEWDNTHTLVDILGSVDVDVTGSIQDQIKSLKDSLETKVEKNGYYKEMAVGNAEQLLSDQCINDSTPYLYRMSGGLANIDNCDREYDKIIGGSIIWNQLCWNGNFKNNQAWVGQWSDLSIENNIAICTKNREDSSVALRRSSSSYPQPIKTVVVANHVYFASALIKSSKDTIARFYLYNMPSNNVNISANVETLVCGIMKPTGETDNGFNVYYDISNIMSIGESATIRNVMLFDLTIMFGVTIADYIYDLEQTNVGEGVAFFKKIFPLDDYYEYNAGEMMHVSGLQSHEMVGFNQWDEEWELGGYISKTGNKTPYTDRIRCKNYIHVFPNTAYYFNVNALNYAYCYDARKKFLGIAPHIASGTGWICTTLQGTEYMTFDLGTAYGTVYKNDICINFAQSNSRNGEYKPYEKYSYTLDSSITLRGIPKYDNEKGFYWNGDIYKADGTIIRKYGIIDLGTLSWSYDSPSGRFYTTKIAVKATTTTDYVINAVCPLFSAVRYSLLDKSRGFDKIMGAITAGSSTYFSIINSSYTDIASFKAAMSGVMLVYELAVPIIKKAIPYNKVQIVDDWGTEEYISTSIVPVGHETRYPINLRNKIQYLPNIADMDGTYVIQQHDLQMTLIPTKIPTVPTADGLYTLKANVVNGMVTYTWET